jgi:hypothetical protein
MSKIRDPRSPRWVPSGVASARSIDMSGRRLIRPPGRLTKEKKQALLAPWIEKRRIWWEAEVATSRERAAKRYAARPPHIRAVTDIRLAGESLREAVVRHLGREPTTQELQEAERLESYVDRW